MLKAMASTLVKSIPIFFHGLGEEEEDAWADDPEVLLPGDEVDEELVVEGVVPPEVVSSGPPGGEYAIRALPGLVDVDPEADCPGWEAVAEDGLPLDRDWPDEGAGGEVPPDVDLADGEPEEDADEGELLEVRLADEGDVAAKPPADVSSVEEPSSKEPSEPSAAGSELSSAYGSDRSSSDEFEFSSAEIAEDPDVGVPEALGEVEGEGALPCVGVRGDPEDKAPYVLLEEELPDGEPAPDVGVLEPDL